MKKQYILDFLKSQKKDFAEKYGVVKIGLFGSYARDEQNENSDIDIAVETNESDYFVLYELKEKLKEKFGLHVDLLRLREKMNPSLKKRIEKEACYV